MSQARFIFSKGICGGMPSLFEAAGFAGLK
jgi:hypothetical protein